MSKRWMLALGLVAAMTALGWVSRAALASPAAILEDNPARAAACANERTIQVSGGATIYVIPDRALIKLGVEATDATAQGVQDKTLKANQQIIKAVRDLGVSAQDISTDYYVINPVYESIDSR